MSEGRSLADLLDRLFQLCLEEPPQSQSFREFAEPARLEILWNLLFEKTVARGSGPDVARLVLRAGWAASAGLLPVAAPLALRHALELALEESRAAGAWDARPAWWEPLTPATPPELALSQLLRRSPPFAKLSPLELSDGFCAPQAPGWLALPQILHPTQAALLFHELESAFLSCRLPIAPAGVGPEAQISYVRSDWMRFIQGDEPEFLASCPRTAVYIQWCVRHLPQLLAPAAPGQPLLIRRSMIARYPAPSVGYHGHLDNPGGAEDNGRALTILTYLNPPDTACQGGELAIWSIGTSVDQPPSTILAPEAGDGAVFSSRHVPHMVCQLQHGPARWAISFFLHDDRGPAAQATPPPQIQGRQLWSVIDVPPLSPNRVIFREIRSNSHLLYSNLLQVPHLSPRIGVVSTVYKAEPLLQAWCQHHLDLGFSHLILVFDHLSQPGEAACAQRLRDQWDPQRLSIWDGEQLLAQGWPALPPHVRDPQLLRYALSGSSSSAVSARQTLNASSALHAARNGQLASPLDWLLHIDADELFYLQGAHQGGATLQQHFAAAHYGGARLIRYANHELLLGQAQPRFKLNPYQAELVQRAEWERLQTPDRCYFTGYTNGKSAVSVPDASAAAGVHSWTLDTSCGPSATLFLAGPAILHFHLSTQDSFRQKYLDYASTPNELPALFPPLYSESAALELIRTARQAGTSQTQLEVELESLRKRLTDFSEREVKQMEEAGLLFMPVLKNPLPFG